jgi:hypothetical protein
MKTHAYLNNRLATEEIVMLWGAMACFDLLGYCLHVEAAVWEPGRAAALARRLVEEVGRRGLRRLRFHFPQGELHRAVEALGFVGDVGVYEIVADNS